MFRDLKDFLHIRDSFKPAFKPECSHYFKFLNLTIQSSVTTLNSSRKGTEEKLQRKDLGKKGRALQANFICPQISFWPVVLYASLNFAVRVSVSPESCSWKDNKKE